MVRMITKVFVFECSGIRATHTKRYDEEPSKEQVLKDMKDWFIDSRKPWFAIKENGVETNLKDWI